jgi:beta-barrel assembly-enhancing protease
VLSLMRSGKAARAAQEFSPLQGQITQNPMIASLAGQIMRANKTGKDIIGFYRTATQNFPQHRALTYDYADLLLQEKRHEDALKLLNEQVISYPNDPRLYELQARTYSALGKRQDEHHALAYSYALRGNLHGAIEQLELAKRAGGDYYQLSTIESELKQFRETAAAHEKRN